MGRFFALVFAIVLHVGFILFGGLLFLRKDDEKAKTQEVELLSEDDTASAKEHEKKEDPPPETDEDLEQETEEAPDAAEIIRNLELSAAASAPALEAASLSAIEDALRGLGGGGDFAEALSFSSGGRIGGLAKAGTLDSSLESAFSLAEIDQKPRAIYQSSPLYPSEMRGKRVEGVVTLIFIVDASGKVASPRVEKSSHPAFEKPALSALRQWKFEPGVKGGQRVPCRMRVPIRFQPS